MNRLDAKYKRMFNNCEKYQNEIENLKNIVYGYNAYLDCIVPHASKDFFITSHDCWGIDGFCAQIIEYYSSLSEDSSSYFAGEKTERDKEFLVKLAKCVVYVLNSECEHRDYTFLGMKKLLETFREDYPEDYVPTKEDSTFWHLVNKAIERRDSTAAYPEEIKNAFTDIYTDFDFYYTKRIATVLLYCVRFFLYDQRIDFVSDRIMNLATMELVREIEDRLLVIHENRYPRKEKVTSYE